MSADQLTKRVAHLEAVVNQLVAYVNLLSGDHTAFECAFDVLDERFKCGINIGESLRELRGEKMEEDGIDFEALEHAAFLTRPTP